MSGVYLSRGIFPQEFFRPAVEFILETQLVSGEIPWFPGGHADPWDHVEAAMGLSIGGEYDAAKKAYQWLVNEQLEDGSWWAAYKSGEVDNKERRETNFVAYIATGVWHHYLISQDRQFLASMWPTVKRAIDFVLRLQTEHGEIHWAVDTDGRAKEDALITGCSSIYKSLECASNIAAVLEFDNSSWLIARENLGNALRNHPERFDRTWESKARYSMDWFYPVLTGVYDNSPADRAKGLARLDKRWEEFVEDKLGCRCVSDEPWVTIAESCELVMALLAAGDHARAVEVYSWLHQWRSDDGSYWTGYQMVMDIMWPDEKPTWTAGAILLAADALTDYTRASKLFNSVELLEPSQQAQGMSSAKVLKKS
jgi:hypothetical protein